MKNIFCVILWIILGSYAQGAGGGAAGLEFLNLKLGGRQLSMGDTFIAICDDVNSIQYNPAGVVNVIGHELTFTYLSYFTGISYNYLGYVQAGRRGKGATGFGMAFFSFDALETDFRGEKIGNIKISNIMLILSHGRKIYKDLSAGISLRSASVSLGRYATSVFLFDIGAFYKIPKVINLGFVIENISPGYQFTERESFSRTIKFGLSRAMYDSLIITGIDFVKHQDKPIKTNLGIEFTPVKLISFRAGYKIGYEIQSYSLGFGIRYKPIGFDEFRFDYGLSLMGELGNLHTISFSTKF